ncbi:MAG: drug/metabolite transporter (DMT)-like permease [Gammaproteobacteria bacterium]
MQCAVGFSGAFSGNGMTAIGFACLSLLFAAALDLSFNQYANAPRSRGMYVAGIGLVWGVLQLLFADLDLLSWPTDSVALGFCVAAGLCVAVANLLLIESLSHVDVSLGSTVYRLNTVGVVLLSFLLLGEPLGMAKLTAIALGVSAAVLLYGAPAGATTRALHNAFFWLVVLASALRACFGILSKAALTYGVNQSTLLLAGAVSWIIGGLLYAWLRERRVKITVTKLGYSAVSGTLVFLVVNTLILGLQKGDASTVIPIANLSFVLVLIVSIALRMEVLTRRKACALVLAIACIWMMSTVPA